jgi:hypothetical protein
MVEQFQKTKQLPEGAEQYFGVDAKKAFAAAEAKAKRLGKGKNWKEKEVQAQMSEFEREAQLASEGKPVIPLGGVDERTLIKTKYPGITDDLLNKILIDDNPQRKAEVMATMDEYLKLREIGKSEAEAFDIISKFIKKTPTKHAEGGIAGQLHLHRPGYKSGALVKLLNLLKGKKKNVWRGFETDYKNILKGDWYPEEFSGRFFTPDKDLAKWYAMRQGTLTGKVKKLKLTEKEIKEAQEFAEKNLKMKYGDDLLVSEELAEKAKVDLPATALAKIEAVIRKAKRTKKAKKHGQTDWAEGGRVSYTKGGLAKILGV